MQLNVNRYQYVRWLTYETILSVPSVVSLARLYALLYKFNCSYGVLRI